MLTLRFSVVTVDRNSYGAVTPSEMVMLCRCLTALCALYQGALIYYYDVRARRAFEVQSFYLSLALSASAGSLDSVKNPCRVLWQFLRRVQIGRISLSQLLSSLSVTVRPRPSYICVV